MESLSKLYDGCRSYRRFQQKQISLDILKELTETARKRSSAMNAQQLRIVVVSRPETVATVQPCLHWAAKLPKEIGTPKEGEQPTAFVIILEPERANQFAYIDSGIMLDTMAVVAWQYGIGSCMINNINRKELARAIPVPDGFVIGTVLALGYPDHTSTVVTEDPEHGLSYYVDADRNYYVPKRSSEEVITFV